VAVRRLVSFVVAVTMSLALLVLAAPAALAQPANDDFANATVIDPSSLPFTDTVDATGATTEADEPTGGCVYDGGTVWYAFTPSSSGVFQVDTTASSYYHAILIYTGSSLPTLSLVTCGYPADRPTFRATAGTTYYIQVGPYTPSGTGTLQLTLSQVPPPANDDFADATTIGSVPFTDTVDLTAATTQPSEPSPSCVGLQNTAWYAFTPASTQFVLARTDQNGAGLGVYTGTTLADLTQVGCAQYSFQHVVFRAQADTTYYFQVGGWCCDGSGPVTFRLEVAPNPAAEFYFTPGDPSVFDTVQFQDTSYDPVGAGIASQTWDLGDGTTATGCCPTHHYAQDGDYTVQLTVTTSDGRTGSTSQVVHVGTHDVAVVQLAVPNAAHVAQTIAISVYVRTTRYPERVQVDLYKSVPGGFEQVGSLTQSVPVRRGGRTTRFAFTYTITPADRTIGKVSFKAVATIIDHHDALPGDNDLISPPVKIT
jgi:PKD repeat protein